MSVIDPQTELGQRLHRELAEEIVVWMTTTSEDGTPQPNPVWFITDGDDVVVYSHNAAARNRNIQRNPRVSLNFNSDHHGDIMSVIIGTARIDPSLPAPADSPEFQQKYAHLIPPIGMTIEEHSATYGVPIRITPTRVRGW